MGFEPMSPLSQAKRLAGARTRPLCDPSLSEYMLSNGPNPSNRRLTPGPRAQGWRSHHGHITRLARFSPAGVRSSCSRQFCWRFGLRRAAQPNTSRPFGAVPGALSVPLDPLEDIQSLVITHTVNISEYDARLHNIGH